MSAPRSYRTSGIVLRARNLGEADKIFTLFTQERGKLDAVAKGVRRANSRIAGRLEFASEAALMMHRGRNLDVIASAEIERAFWSTITDPTAFATAHVLAELVDAFCELDFAMPDVYALLRGALAALVAAPEPAAIVPRFSARLLVLLGVGPESDGCVRCARPLDDCEAWADIEAGGLACQACRPHRADGHALSPEDVWNFRGLVAERGGDVKPVLVATPASARAVDAFVTWNVGRRMKAFKMLDDLARVPG